MPTLPAFPRSLSKSLLLLAFPVVASLAMTGCGAEGASNPTATVRDSAGLTITESDLRDLGGSPLLRIEAPVPGAVPRLRERLAADAERDSVALKKVEFMERHLGEEFTGTVSGVTAFGVFVLLDEYFVEGLLHVNSLLDDFYVLQEHDYALVGERSGRRFRLGDTLTVQVSRVNRLDRTIDFALAEGP